MPEIKPIKEHDCVSACGLDLLSYDEKLRGGLCLNPEASDFDRRYFLQWNLPDSAQGYMASYVVGAQWVETSRYGIFPLQVLPKIEKIDFLKMFMQCFYNPDEHESFSKIYGIDFGAEPIVCDALESVLSPLLIVQYVKVVQRLMNKDLRRNYVNQSENLNKIRGRIAISANLRTNAMHGRQHKIFCNYQEFTIDTIENRIIKKALKVSKNIIRRSNSLSAFELSVAINGCLSKMVGVADNVSPGGLKQVRYNAIYKGYREAVILAKYILKRYDHNLSDAPSVTGKIPPFWIDMPLLFEHYVGGILARSYPGDIIYQAKGKTGCPDFLSKKTRAILDTKYKPKLDDGRPEPDIVRQLAGYGRDCKILDLLGADYKTVLPCVFIYPDEDASESGETVFSKPLTELLSSESGYAVDGITDFYCIGVGIPKLG